MLASDLAELIVEDFNIECEHLESLNKDFQDKDVDKLENQAVDEINDFFKSLTDQIAKLKEITIKKALNSESFEKLRFILKNYKEHPWRESLKKCLNVKKELSGFFENDEYIEI